MFAFLRRKKSRPGRDGVFEDLRRAAEELKTADPATRIKVGMAINIATTAFAGTYRTTSTFQSVPYEQQMQYMTKFKVAQEQARAKGDSAAALGFSLFNIWLCAIVTSDGELMAHIKPELTKLSREADVIQSVL